MSNRRRAVLTAAVVVLAPVVLLLIWRVGADGVLAGVEVGGVDVGGLDRDELTERVIDIEARLLDEAVVVEGERGTFRSFRREAGFGVDVEATVDAAWRRGRQPNVVTEFADHVSARLGRTLTVDPRTHVDEATLSAWARRAATELTAERRDATVTFATDPQPPGDREESRAQPVEPAPGRFVDPAALADRAREALDEPGPVRIDAPADHDPPVTTRADLDAVLPDARRAVSRPVVLENPSRGEDLRLGTRALAAALRVDADEAAPEGERLSLAADAEALADWIGGDKIAAMNAAPRDATFAVDDGEVRIRGGRPGYRFDAAAVAAAALELATSGQRTGALPGDRPKPDFTRADAKGLRIREKVSEFTTEHACCPPRVQNIHRIADLVDGVVIRPGASLSLNDHVGKRTRKKGFVSAGVIEDGEFEEDVGGGISQFATTFFNAAFFAGIQIDEFQPHSYYISRYPVGHESTIAFGLIDVVVTNDSPHGILVKTSYTDTSITVTFYSSDWAEVEVDVGPRRNIVEGDVRDGFDVSFTRTITYPDGEEKVEDYFHRYEPENED